MPHSTLVGQERCAFVHEALLYDDLDTFVTRVGAFVREGVDAGESVLVATDAAKCEALRDQLGDLGEVQFVNMAVVGRNPGRIIPVWRDFVATATAGGRLARGVGEPVWPGRDDAAIIECQTHEAMLDVAFGDGPCWTLLCPYDATGLPEDVLAEAMRTHDGMLTTDVSDRLARPLPEPTGFVHEVAFAGDAFVPLRDEVERQARKAGVSRDRAGDLCLAVHELATNSVRHGGGGGVARMWQEAGGFVVEIRDRGHVTDPLVGRAKPDLDDEGGRGLWIVHQLCDLVQMRTSPDGTVVRVHMHAG